MRDKQTKILTDLQGQPLQFVKDYYNACIQHNVDSTLMMYYGYKIDDIQTARAKPNTTTIKVRDKIILNTLIATFLQHIGKNYLLGYLAATKEIIKDQTEREIIFDGITYIKQRNKTYKSRFPLLEDYISWVLLNVFDYDEQYITKVIDELDIDKWIEKYGLIEDWTQYKHIYTDKQNKICFQKID